ncbi:MAG: MFS transporter [Pseudomonadota bacterium]|mgnify:CR=1 FL=1
MSIHTVFVIALCNMASLRASKVLVALFAIELGANPFMIGTLVAVYSLFPMLLALYAGRLADRLGVRMPMMAGSFGVALGLAAPFVMPSLTGLYVSAALIGASYVFYHVSVQNLIGLLSTPEERTRNFSSYSLVLAVGSFIGPLAAGFGIDALGHVRAYLCLSVVPLVAFGILLARGRYAPAPVKTEEGQKGKKAADLWRMPELRRVFITSAMILTGIDLFQFYLPIYGHSVGLSASVIGMILSMFAVAAFVVRTAIPPLVRKLGEEALLRYAMLVGAIGYVLLPLFENPWLLGLVSFILGLGLGAGQPLSMMLTYARSPGGRSGEALGLRLTLNNLTHVVVPLLFGSLGAAFGVAPVFLANALMLGSGGVFGRGGRAGKSGD